jgi:hypothetical protein
MADPPRRWFRFRLRTLLLMTLLAVIGASLYSYWSDYAEQAARRERELLSPSRGTWCVVYMDTSGNPTADQSASGRFFLMNDQWIVLDAEDGARQQWIPRALVKKLVVELK